MNQNVFEDLPPPQFPRRSLAGLKILLVEDDALSREALELVLSAHGASVRSAESVSQALLLLEGEEPGMLISDIGLPGVDGYELMRRIRAREADEGGHLAALAVSGFSDVSGGLARAAGFDGFLCKPVNIDALVARVRGLANP
ncbi:MAG: response regulator [bacterium]